MFAMASYQCTRRNAKLTDFEGLREYIVHNAVRRAPRAVRSRPGPCNTLLSSF